MTYNELHEIAEKLQERLGTETLLNELLQAMDTNELQANLEHIDNMHDTGFIE